VTFLKKKKKPKLGKRKKQIKSILSF